MQDERTVEVAPEEADWRRRSRAIGREPVAVDDAAAMPDVAEAIAEIQMEFQQERSAIGGRTDWRRVADRSEDVLRRGGKDVRAAVFLAVAWSRLEGLEGWASGLAVIGEMLGAHWPDVLPEPGTRLRAHVAAMELLLDRLGEDVERGDPPARETAVRLLESADLLRTAIEGTVSTSTPLPSDLRGRVDGRLGRFGHEWRQAVELTSTTSVEDVVATGNPGPPPPDASRPSAPAAARRAPLDAASASKELPAARARVMEIAATLQADDPFQPEPYTLLRAVAWANAEALELVTGEDGRPRLLGMPGPAGRDLPSATGPIADRDLVACEAIVRKKPYWLDASVRMAALLEARGAEAARTAVAAHLVGLLARRPQLREACFEDGTPLLLERPPQLMGIGRESGGIAAASSPGSSPHPSAGAEDSDTSADGGEGTAGTPGILPAYGGRAALITTLAAVETRGRDIPPMHRDAILRSLLERIERMSLEDWEPTLAAEVYRTILKVADPAAAEPRAQALDGLARVQPDLLIDGGF